MSELATRDRQARGGQVAQSKSRCHEAPSRPARDDKDRIEFAQLIADIARSWEQDPKLNADPELNADPKLQAGFASRFAETRRTLSRHQAA